MACSSCMKSAARRAGSAAYNPLTLGEAVGNTYRVKVLTSNIPGLPQGSVRYIRGSQVEQYVESGDLQILQTSTNHRRSRSTKLFYVGDLGYSELQAAQVRSEETGLPIIEKVI